MELFKDLSYSYDFCTLPTQSDVVCASHNLYLILQEDDSYSLPCNYFPVGTTFKETDFLSTSSQHRVSQYYPN